MILSISKRLKILRNNLGMNQFEFAQYLNLKQSTLSAYERDISNPSLDVLLMISEKCNVSMDWLCSRESSRHYVTMADIIQELSQIRKIDGLDLNIKPTKHLSAGPEGTYKYSCELSFTSYFNEYASTEDNLCASHLCKFIFDWKTTEEQLALLTDDEIIENYKQMWLEKQIAHYSTIPVKTRMEANKEGSHKVYERWIPHHDELKLGEE